jgi:hypothetical protein
MKSYLLFFVNVMMLSNLEGHAQISKIKNDQTISFDKEPTCNCDSLWKKPDARDFVRLLEKATTGMQVWPGYDLGNATFILDAGKTGKGDHCLGLWKKGKAVSFAQLKDSIRMLTPIYSYYLKYKEMDSIPADPLFQTARNAPGFVNWMTELNVSTAVYMPVSFPKLPFSLPPVVKVQLGIHEAFHVEVMLKYWYTGTGSWPKWDKQPDRGALQVCYTNNDPERTLIQKELMILADLVEALLDGRKENARILGDEYLHARNNRYKGSNDIKIKLADDVRGDCEAAESIMELEEGLADYGSWKILFDMGMVNREELLKRYRAKQKDHFYLSGCMLMHAITLMSDKPQGSIQDEIVHSVAVEKGSLLHIFKNKLNEYAKN